MIGWRDFKTTHGVYFRGSYGVGTWSSERVKRNFTGYQIKLNVYYVYTKVFYNNKLFCRSIVELKVSGSDFSTVKSFIEIFDGENFWLLYCLDLCMGLV